MIGTQSNKQQEISKSFTAFACHVRAAAALDSLLARAGIASSPASNLDIDKLEQVLHLENHIVKPLLLGLGLQWGWRFQH